MADGTIETSDFNDGDILAKTTQVPCGKNGGTQFKYVLPDGHEIKSECVPEEHKKTALHRWVDAVKEAAVARAREERAELAAKIRRQKVDAEIAAAEEAERQRSQLIVPGSVPSPAASIPAQPAPSATVRVSAPTAGVHDPVAMARAQLTEASLEVQRLRPLLQEAEARMRQWATVLQALNAIELPRESSVIVDATSLLERS